MLYQIVLPAVRFGFRSYLFRCFFFLTLRSLWNLKLLFLFV